MISKLYKWAAGVLIAVAALVGLYLKGRASGVTSEKTKQAKSDLKAIEQKTKVLKDASEVSSNVARLPVGDAVRELQDKYSRD